MNSLRIMTYACHYTRLVHIFPCEPISHKPSQIIACKIFFFCSLSCWALGLALWIGMSIWEDLSPTQWHFILAQFFPLRITKSSISSKLDCHHYKNVQAPFTSLPNVLYWESNLVVFQWRVHGTNTWMVLWSLSLTTESTHLSWMTLEWTCKAFAS